MSFVEFFQPRIFFVAGLCLCFFVCDNASAENRTNAAALLPARDNAEIPCRMNNLLVYKVIFKTFWSRTLFPKHYPDWRPTAQWSKVLGFVHDESFHLFRLGQKTSPAVKFFAETGRSDILDQQKQQSQGTAGIFDEFHAPPILQGVGQSEVQFYVDSNFSKVSLMSRIIPSPDWFVGVDSFNLCRGGKWLDTVTIEVDPIDAGTDNGFTFTAPNWATDPQSEAYQITAHYPAHPASSFFYPHLRKLPTIAAFKFIKMKEYKMSRTYFSMKEKPKYEAMEDQQMLESNSISIFHNVGTNPLYIDVRRKKPEDPKQFPKSSNNYLSNLIPVHTASTKSYGMNNLTASGDPITTTFSSNVVTLDEKETILNGITNLYLNPQRREKHSYIRNQKRRKHTRKHHPPRDCRVSDWGVWSNCSKSCGIGEMTRRRRILKHSRHGGRVCPPLIESKWCGSARSCNKKYFEW